MILFKGINVKIVRQRMTEKSKMTLFCNNKGPLKGGWHQIIENSSNGKKTLYIFLFQI